MQPCGWSLALSRLWAGIVLRRTLIAHTNDKILFPHFQENDLVNVMYEINSEWLYGSMNGDYGQFPANFIEYVPQNLPQMPK
jgi:hypothetical protein